jgi:hypothetical protein
MPMIWPTEPFDAERYKAVLEAMAEGLTVVKACERANVSRVVLRAWQKAEPALLDDWELARQAGADELTQRAADLLEAKPLNDAQARQAQRQANYCRWLASCYSSDYHGMAAQRHAMVNLVVKMALAQVSQRVARVRSVPGIDQATADQLMAALSQP